MVNCLPNPFAYFKHYLDLSISLITSSLLSCKYLADTALEIEKLHTFRTQPFSLLHSRFSRRDEVERANQRKLESIQAETRVFKSSDTGDVQKLDSNSLAPRELALKLDAQVMLVKNLDKTFVNGAVGKVVGFNEESGYPIVSFNLKHGLVEEREICDEAFSINDGSGAVIAQRIQVPLILAWAISIHKSQGQTLDRLIVDSKRNFPFCEL